MPGTVKSNKSKQLIDFHRNFHHFSHILVVCFPSYGTLKTFLGKPRELTPAQSLNFGLAQ